MKVRGYYSFVLLFIFTAVPGFVRCQVTSDEVKSVLLLRFCENVTWESPLKNKITIGCYSDDDAVYQLLKHAESKKLIHGLPIEIKKLKEVGDFYGCQAVYFKRSSLKDIKSAIRVCQENNILFVTDDVDDPLFITINLIEVNSKITFKVNMPNLTLAGFQIKPNLLLSGGSLVDIKQAYEKFENQLKEKNTKLDSANKALDLLEKKLDVKDITLLQKEKEFEVMIAELSQLKLISNNLITEINSKKNSLKKDSIEITTKEEELKFIYDEISKKKIELDKMHKKVYDFQKQSLLQMEEIKNKNRKLSFQENYISEQNRILLFALIFIAILLFVAIAFYWILNMKRVHNLELEKKNIEIKKQFEIQSLQKKQIQSAHEQLLNYQSTLENTVNIRTDELKVSTKILEIRNQQLEEFAYVVAHNLRGPVSTMLGLVNLSRLNKEENNADALEYYFDRSEEVAMRIDDVIKGMMQILSSESIDTPFSYFPIAPILEDVKILLKAEIEQSNATILTSGTALESLYGVPVYYNSILYNLISNAIKYRRKQVQPEISIVAVVENNHLVLSISDNGIGIDLERLKDKLYRPFSKLTSNSVGLGIGLYTVRMHVTAMKGKMEIESKVKEGTTFKIVIPYT